MFNSQILILTLPCIYGAQLDTPTTYAILHVCLQVAYSALYTMEFAQWAIYVIIYFLFWYNNNNNNNNNNYIYLLQLGCHPLAVVILHVYKI